MGSAHGQPWLGLSLRFVSLACLLMLLAVADAAPYVTTSFSILTRSLSQAHCEMHVPGHFLDVLKVCMGRWM